MWTSYRRHELVYAQPPKRAKAKEEYHDESDAYTDAETSADEYIEPRRKFCWVRGREDERTDPMWQVLFWEDIDLQVLKNPENNGGRDRLAMTVLLRFHKGSNKEKVPTWFPFVEEKVPLICPISHIPAKALVEGAVDGYSGDISRPFFNMKLRSRALKIYWKREFLHKPVFRKPSRN
jgi:hypothetical protein